ncbi:hypothetical protein [Roseicella frigidaeris]|uniref:hypothetical protein n=1 Tax=Roseicella frigidaeris TaxID=2230885 RepID=UPI0014029C3A|nr:hypothetical protein [Roseicella frigidaeris]
MSWLFGLTLVAALAIGIWQFLSVRRSRAKRGEEGPVKHPLGAGRNTPPQR